MLFSFRKEVIGFKNLVRTFSLLPDQKFENERQKGFSNQIDK